MNGFLQEGSGERFIIKHDPQSKLCDTASRDCLLGEIPQPGLRLKDTLKDMDDVGHQTVFGREGEIAGSYQDHRQDRT